MMNFLSTVKTAAQKRAAYSRTVSELESLPRTTAWDLGMTPGDERRIAHKAVYGN